VKVLGLHHVNINVHDVEKSVAFYTSLGFEPVPRPGFGFDGAWLQMGLHQLHLVAGTPNTVIDRGQHFALEVADLDECVAELERLGVEARRTRPVAGAGLQAFFRDPSGNLIELNQPALDQPALDQPAR
jgi:catechol 2,3-dioxygenase-like lactoylglutathione lyase family enzyme